MAIIRYVSDPNTGEKQALQLIKQIALWAKQGNNDYRKLAVFITQALVQLEEIGIPNPPELLFKTADIDDPNRTLTFRLLKELKYHPPLLEFRVNQQPYAFRAIFFFDTIDNEQVIFFTRALLKSIANKNPPELEQCALETEQIYGDYLTDRGKYLK